MSFTQEESFVLDYFFTNLEKPVFVARNFHPEVWALMQARYSRSKQGMRESFLNLLKEDENNYQTLASSLSNPENQEKMQHAVEKAISFMEKWVLGFGHSSVAEAANIGIGLEGISILATKQIQSCRLGSFIEKSTRYVSFNQDSFYFDPVLEKSKFGSQIKDLVSELFKTYMDFHDPVLDYIKQAVPLEQGQSEPAWERSCAARRFDAVRYLLPACTKTSFGWTLNARSLEHSLTKMFSHPLDEVRDLAQTTKQEASKCLPSLLRYTNPSDFLIQTEKAMFSSYKDEQTKDNDYTVRLETTQDIDAVLVASMLYRYSSNSYKSILEKAKAMSQQEKEKVFDEYCSRIGKFDSPLRGWEFADLTWDILLDYGAYRDIQRHRICSQIPQLLTTHNGYSVPKDIVDAGLDKEFDNAMKHASELYNEVAEEYSMQAQYLVPLAFRQRYLLKANMRELFYFIRLRSSSHGHTSYRSVAKQMYNKLKQQYPLAAKYLVCQMNDEELGRLGAETRFEEKLASGKI